MRAALPMRGVCRALLPSPRLSRADRTTGTYIYRACMLSGFDRFVHGHLTLSKRVEVLPSSQKYEDIYSKHDLVGEETWKDANRSAQYKQPVKARKYLTGQNCMEQFDGVDDSKNSNHACLKSGEFDSSQPTELFGDEADTLVDVPSSSEKDETETAIKKKAFQALSARPLTAVQLRKKLIGNNFPPDMVEAVIIELQASGIQSDYEYAEAYCRSRWLSLSWGPNRIKPALMRRGVSRANAEKALRLIFNDNDEMDEKKKWGMSDSARKHLLVQASKKWLQGESVSFETRKRRMVSWLQYRGFNWEVIFSVLKELQSNHPGLDK